LVLWVLLLVAFGAVEFGDFFYAKHSLQGAAREGARAAIPSAATYADIGAAIDKAIRPTGISSYTYSVQKSLGGGSYTTINAGNFSTLVPGDAVVVTVQSPWGTVGLRPLSLIPASKQVTGAAVMRKEE
jgi:Flp pilus assembly protein TadG